ncbi:MAG: PIN domain-containing protein [Deltaproteobacteria bacterium]|nr:PIN domain-containing protein [Deltaproteobacteria bacterium]
MIGIDTNVLVAICVLEHEHHAKVKNWVSSVGDPLSTTLVNTSEFLRLLTHPRVFPKPLKFRDACNMLDELINAYDLRVFSSSFNWWQNGLEKIPSGVGGNSIFDFQIAYTFFENGVKRISTFDNGFKRYSFIKSFEPA